MCAARDPFGFSEEVTAALLILDRMRLEAIGAKLDSSARPVKLLTETGEVPARRLRRHRANRSTEALGRDHPSVARGMINKGFTHDHLGSHSDRSRLKPKLD